MGYRLWVMDSWRSRVMDGWRILIYALIFISHFSFFISAHAQNITYDTDTACGCDIVYVDGIQTTREGDLYGFRRSDGRVIFPNIFHYVDQFSNGYCRVWQVDTAVSLAPLAGLIDSSGHQILPCIYDAVDLPSSGRILVGKNGLFGYTDLSGNLVIPFSFSDASPFVQNRACVALVVDSFYLFYTFIDTLGRQLFPPVFQNARPFIDGFAPVFRYDRWGIIDTLGNEIVPTAYEHLSYPDHGTFFAGDSSGMALFRLPSNASTQSRIQALTPFVYQPVTLVSEGRIGVSRGGKQGFLDLQGNEIIPCRYDEIGLFRQGRTLARIGDSCGIIDTLGRIILPLQYSDRTPKGIKYAYYDTLALVEKDGRLGYVDLDGQFVVPLVLEEAYQFSEGLAAVKKDGLWGYIDTHGDPFIPFLFDIAPSFRYGRAEVYFHGRPLTIDRQGRCVRNCNGIISFR